MHFRHFRTPKKAPQEARRGGVGAGAGGREQQDLDKVRKLAGDFTGQPRSPLTASIAALLRPFVYLYLCSVSVIVSVTAAVAVTTFVSIIPSATTIVI